MPSEDEFPDGLPDQATAPQKVSASSVAAEPPPTILAPRTPAASEPAETRFLKWTIFGDQGLRVGWSVALFVVLVFIFSGILELIAQVGIAARFHIKLDEFAPVPAILQELVQFLPILAAAAIAALIERRRVLDYNLSGPRRLKHFFTGTVAGFAALSALVGVLYWGGWLRFGSIALSGSSIYWSAALWAIAFLLTGFSEEGSVRCYLLFTLTRGINYWWALGSVAAISLFAWLNPHSNGPWGVYITALLGVAPCLFLHLKKSPAAGFWQAAWLTSTLFGYMHTFNDGETWFGIFCTAAIGFVFCVSVRLTGSAWWAIGFHGAWDWAQTFFYGTPDSGFQAKGHYLTTNPTGPVLWSGGADGPEGSLLVLPTILLVLAGLIIFYRRQARLESASPAALPQLS
jgi:hypothetical protein